jgi:hypothetical protein
MTLQDIKEIEIDTFSGIEIYVIIDRGNGEYTSMPKSVYDELKANEASTI